MGKITKSQLAQYIISESKKLMKKQMLKEEKIKLEKKIALLEGRSFNVSFEYTDYSDTIEGEKTYAVTCRVDPGDSGSFYGGPDGVGSPPEPGDVDIIEVIDVETGLPVDINSLSEEVLSGMLDKAESEEDGAYLDEPDWDMMHDDLDEAKDENSGEGYDQKENGYKMACMYGVENYIDKDSIVYSPFNDDEGSWNLEFNMLLPKKQVLGNTYEEAYMYLTKILNKKDYSGPGAPYSNCGVYGLEDQGDFWLVMMNVDGGYDI